MRLRSVGLAVSVFLFTLPLFAYRTAAWIPPWDEKSLTSIQLHAGDLDESNPVWYSLSASGAIVANWNAENPTWIAAMTGTSVVPTIQNVVNGVYSASVAETLLATSASREAHAQAIFNLVVAKGWDGIDVDYERVPTTSRANFTAFVNTLAAKLHSAGKVLSVTVYAKISDSQNWNGPGAQDWIALGQAADSIKIMAYDYHWSTSAAGPLTPLTWLDQVATYAETAIPAAKIMIGLPWYGYDWQGSNGRGIVYEQAAALALANGATITRDVNGEATFTYADHVVYFQDATSYTRKTDLLRQKHPNIGGITHWRTGGENADFWTAVRALRGAAPVPPPPPATGDFTVSGSDTLSVRAGKSTSETYTITRLNGFTGTIAATVEKPASLNATVTIDGSTLRVATSRSTALGTYQLRLRFTSGSLVREKLVTLTVRK